MASEDIQLVVFSVEVSGSSCNYGIPILQAQGIERLPEITILPQAENFIEGIINLRNEIVPLIDLKILFNFGRTKHGEDTRIIIFDMNIRKLGIIVDNVQEVIHVNKNQIESDTSYLELICGAGRQYVMGIAKVEGKLVIMIDLTKILTLEQQSSLEMMAYDTCTTA